MSVDPTTALPSRPSPGAAGARLGELYAEHSRMVYGVCRMLLRDPDEAEDATQQVFLAAYRNLLTGTAIRDPAAWLGTIARNACRRRSAMRMREPLALADDAITRVSPGAEEAAIGREEAAELYAELELLPHKQREAVVLRDLYGLRYDEVAKALGTSRAAVEALLFRGRRRLQRRLRPGVAAGVLVVPLAVQESIAYAVPGFAATAAPAGAAATAAAVPLLVKLAAGGAAIGIAGSAGVVAERGLHDPPGRPAAAVVRPSAAAPAESAVGAKPSITVVRGSLVEPAATGARGSSSAGEDEPARAAGLPPVDDDRDERGGDEGNSGPAGGKSEPEPEPEPERERGDSSGPGASGRSGASEEHAADEPVEVDEPDAAAEPTELDEPDR